MGSVGRGVRDRDRGRSVVRGAGAVRWGPWGGGQGPWDGGRGRGMEGRGRGVKGRVCGVRGRDRGMGYRKREWCSGAYSVVTCCRELRHYVHHHMLYLYLARSCKYHLMTSGNTASTRVALT